MGTAVLLLRILDPWRALPIREPDMILGQDAELLIYGSCPLRIG